MYARRALARVRGNYFGGPDMDAFKVGDNAVYPGHGVGKVVSIDTKEILGQITRLIFGGVKSFVGTVPIGNTGGANVPPLKPMEIPKDIQDILNKNI